MTTDWQSAYELTKRDLDSLTAAATKLIAETRNRPAREYLLVQYDLVDALRIAVGNDKLKLAK